MINDGFCLGFNKLHEYVRIEQFKGWDPYDGLNSRLFQATPLKNNRFFRLAWIQLFKRNPINLRKIALIEKDYNPKGLGLFLYSYCKLIYIDEKILDFDKEEIKHNIEILAEQLIKMISPGYSGTCWGYNFDWQNRVFFQPKGTPTVVATSFIANAFFEAFDVTGNQKYFDIAIRSVDFVLKDLNRTKEKNGFVFSYSPLDNSKVYNATLLGARLLARGYHYTKNEKFRELAKQAVLPIVNKQKINGSWIYGEAKTQNWIDSFHSGYNLECLYDYAFYTKDNQFNLAFEKGFDYYIKTFFLLDGKPKYYHNKLYPIDIHASAQLIVTLSKTDRLVQHISLANRVLKWTIENMQDEKGYFYYQLKPYLSSKIPYMRWAEAWMFYAFSNYYHALNSNENLV
jgi:hypothetical protein